MTSVFSNHRFKRLSVSVAAIKKEREHLLPKAGLPKGTQGTFAEESPDEGIGCPPHGRSEDFALVNAEQLSPGLLLVLLHRQPHRVLKHLLHSAVVQGRALQVALGTNLMRHFSPL